MKKGNEYLKREIERLKNANRELCMNAALLRKEIDSKNSLIDILREENKKLITEYERIAYEESEAIERCAEARLQYEEAIASAKGIEQLFRELIIKLGIDIKKMNGGV